MKSYTKEELHQNFILIHEYLYPTEPLKHWVRHDLNYHGNYHESWEDLMVIVQHLCHTKEKTMIALLMEFQDQYLNADLHSKYHLYYAVICQLNKLKFSKAGQLTDE